MQLDMLTVSLLYDSSLCLLSSGAAVFVFVSSAFALLWSEQDKQDCSQVAVLSTSSERSPGRNCTGRLQWRLQRIGVLGLVLSFDADQTKYQGSELFLSDLTLTIYGWLCKHFLPQCFLSSGREPILLCQENLIHHRCNSSFILK